MDSKDLMNVYEGDFVLIKDMLWYERVAGYDGCLRFEKSTLSKNSCSKIIGRVCEVSSGIDKSDNTIKIIYPIFNEEAWVPIEVVEKIVNSPKSTVEGISKTNSSKRKHR